MTIAVEMLDGKEVCSETFTPTSNIGNAADKAFSGTKVRNFEFDITEAGRYAITFYTAGVEWADLMIGEATIVWRRISSALPSTPVSAPMQVNYYSLSGQRIPRPTKGCYVVQTITADGNQQTRIVQE